MAIIKIPNNGITTKRLTMMHSSHMVISFPHPKDEIYEWCKAKNLKKPWEDSNGWFIEITDDLTAVEFLLTWS
jgi:hypothetical protein